METVFSCKGYSTWFILADNFSFKSNPLVIQFDLVNYMPAL